MRFEHYINEEVVKIFKTEEEIDSLIKKNCKYYKSLGNFHFFRGIKQNSGGQFGENSVRQNRKSRGMTARSAKSVNKWLVKNGHTDRSKSMFAGSDPTRLYLFSQNIYEIFPIGKFNYTFIKVADINMFGKYDSEIRALKDYDMEGDPFNYLDNMNDIIITNKNMKEAYDKKYEIWFDCKSYYYKYFSSYG